MRPNHTPQPTALRGAARLSLDLTSSCVIFSFEKRRLAMKIDIDKLTEAELVDLNNKIVARLRFLNQMKTHSKMLEFSVGDRVAFQPPNGAMKVGMLTRYNKKTVTVITDTGEHWNVGPQMLRRAETHDQTVSRDSNIVPLHKK
jgi:hypothetical protein